MGLLGNLAKQAVNSVAGNVVEGIGEGIASGIAGAAGKAVEKAVAPAADRLAGAAANQIDTVTKDVNAAGEAVAGTAPAAASAVAGAAGAAGAAAPAVGAGGGFAALGSMLGNLAGAATGFAASAAANFQECPTCGQPAPLTQAVCGNCGTKLTGVAIGADAVCPSCGTQNLPETAFCVKCGAKLPWAQKNEAAFATDWAAKLAAYPKWTAGGHGFEIEDAGESCGLPVYTLVARGVTAAMVEQYKAALTAVGFVKSDRASCYYALIGNVCRAVNSDIYLNDGELRMDFYAESYDAVKPVAAAPKAAAGSVAGSVADAATDALKGAAKSILGGFFK